MRKNFKCLLMCLLCCTALISNAQTISVTDKGLVTSKPIYWGDQWSVEVWEDGLNFWKPWPSSFHGNYKLYIDTTGKVGVGRKPTTYKLEVDGDVYTTGAYRTASDVRLKDNISPLQGALSKIQQVNGKVYNKLNYPILNKEEEVNKLIEAGKASPDDRSKVIKEMCDYEKNVNPNPEFGVIAQELMLVYPELVQKDENGYLSVNYIGLIPVLVEALKEQQVIIDKQHKDFEELSDIVLNNKSK